MTRLSLSLSVVVAASLSTGSDSVLESVQKEDVRRRVSEGSLDGTRSIDRSTAFLSLTHTGTRKDGSAASIGDRLSFSSLFSRMTRRSLLSASPPSSSHPALLSLSRVCLAYVCLRLRSEKARRTDIDPLASENKCTLSGVYVCQPRASDTQSLASLSLSRCLS